jgi:hypothetical protein
MLRYLIALALLLPAQVQPPLLRASTARATTAETWTYAIAVDQPMQVVDVLDMRLAVIDHSSACAFANPIALVCEAQPTEAITITVGIRRNACEPDLCREINWTILNWVEGAGQRSNVVAVQVTRPAPPRPGRYLVWLPIAGR